MRTRPLLAATLLAATFSAPLLALSDPFGNGGPTLSPPATIASNTPGALAVLAVDLDGTGGADEIVVVHDPLGGSGGQLAILDRTPTGGWAKEVIDFTSQGLGDVTAADFDGDGHVDLATVAMLDGAVRWYENPLPLMVTGLGWANHGVASGLDVPRAIEAGDVDGDGLVDLVVAELVGDRVTWLRNVGGGAAWEQRPLAHPVDGPMGLALDDVDLDGDLDVVVAAVNADRVLLFSNPLETGGTGFELWPSTTLALGLGGPTALDTGDLDGDGDVDVAVAATLAGKLVRLMNEPGWPAFVIDSTAPGVRGVHIADVDLDGALDVVSAVELEGVVQVHRGQYGLWSEVVLSASELGANSVVTGDFAGDGVADVAFASFIGASVRWVSFGPPAPFDLQAAIDAAAPGAVIVVPAGAYAPIRIDKSLTLAADGVVTVRVASGSACDVGQSALIELAGPGTGTVVLVGIDAGAQPLMLCSPVEVPPATPAVGGGGFAELWAFDCDLRGVRHVGGGISAKGATGAPAIDVGVASVVVDGSVLRASSPTQPILLPTTYEGQPALRAPSARMLLLDSTIVGAAAGTVPVSSCAEVPPPPLPGVGGDCVVALEVVESGNALTPGAGAQWKVSVLGQPTVVCATSSAGTAFGGASVTSLADDLAASGTAQPGGPLDLTWESGGAFGVLFVAGLTGQPFDLGSIGLGYPVPTLLVLGPVGGAPPVAIPLELPPKPALVGRALVFQVLDLVAFRLSRPAVVAVHP